MHIRESSAILTPNLPQNDASQTSWDPNTISNLVFGTVMVFVGIVAIWQGRHRRVVVLDEELAIIRPLRRPASTANHPDTSLDGAAPAPPPRLTIRDNIIAQLAITNGVSNDHSTPNPDNDNSVPAMPNRVTTLSTIGSLINSDTRHSHAFTLELDVSEAGDTTSTNNVPEQYAPEPEEMT